MQIPAPPPSLQFPFMLMFNRLVSICLTLYIYPARDDPPLPHPHDAAIFSPEDATTTAASAAAAVVCEGVSGACVSVEPDVRLKCTNNTLIVYNDG